MKTERLSPEMLDVAYAGIERGCGAINAGYVKSHIAALEQEVAAAEARGFARAREMALAVVSNASIPPGARRICERGIRAMQDGPGAGVEDARYTEDEVRSAVAAETERYAATVTHPDAPAEVVERLREARAMPGEPGRGEAKCPHDPLGGPRDGCAAPVATEGEERTCRQCMRDVAGKDGFCSDVCATTFDEELGLCPGYESEEPGDLGDDCARCGAPLTTHPEPSP
jgi:hypothetical protein